MSNSKVTEATSRQTDASHAAHSGAVQVLTVLSSLILPVVHILVAHLFGKVIQGIYLSLLSFIEVVTRGGTGGADKAMLRYVAGYRGQGDESNVLRAVGTGLRLCFFVAGSIVVVMIVGAPWLAVWFGRPELASGLPWLAPAALFTGLVYVLVQASLGARNTRANFIVRGLGEPFFLLLAVASFGLFGPSLQHLALAHTLATFATLILAVLVVGRVFGRGQLWSALKKKGLPGFASFSLPMAGAETLNAILSRADLIMLYAFVGEGAVAIYGSAEFLGRSVANIRYAFDSIAAGVLSEALHRGERDRLRYNLALMTRWVVTGAAPIAVLAIVFRKLLLGLYPVGYTAGATAMVILVFSHFLNASLGLTQWLLLVSGRSRLLLLDNFIGACLNIALGLVLIPRWGMVGTAFCVLITIVSFQSLMVWQTWRAERVHPFDRRLARPIVAAGVMLVAMLILSLFLQGWLGLPLLFCSGVAIYLGMLWALGLPEEESQFVSKLRLRFRHR